MYKIDLKEIAENNGGKYSVDNLEQAENFTQKIATSHYENFPVASVLLPKNKRQDIFNIYAFARVADDIADTLLTLSSGERQEILTRFMQYLREYTQGKIPAKKNPILFALSGTINRLQLPLLPFEKLIFAFSFDSDFQHAESWEELLRYCDYSANPVGELVLRVFELYNERTAQLSNAICIGLQLANFWQDFSVDLPNNRIFIPREILRKHSLSEDNYNSWAISGNFAECLDEIFDFTEKYFEIGKELIKLLKPKRLQLEIEITRLGGMMILEKSHRLGTRILSERSVITKQDIMKILIKSLI